MTMSSIEKIEINKPKSNLEGTPDRTKHHQHSNSLKLKTQSKRTNIYIVYVNVKAYSSVRERVKQRKRMEYTRSTHRRESSVKSKAGSWRSSDFNTEYASKNLDLKSLMVFFCLFCFSRNTRREIADKERRIGESDALGSVFKS